jgi:hypothetical protein
MNTQLTRTGLLAPTLILFSSMAAADHFDRDPYALEPSINGGVSATGMFASQEAEDRYLAAQRRYREAMKLEPCMNGAVSATGLFASQAKEDAALQRLERLAGK